jgi:hypothetical protein
VNITNIGDLLVSQCLAWDRIPSLYEKSHTEREKSPTTRTGHRCSHFEVHCISVRLDLIGFRVKHADSELRDAARLQACEEPGRFIGTLSMPSLHENLCHVACVTDGNQDFWSFRKRGSLVKFSCHCFLPRFSTEDVSSASLDHFCTSFLYYAIDKLTSICMRLFCVAVQDDEQET